MSQIEHLETPVTIAPMTEARPLLRGWWRLVDMRIGIIPLPLFPLIVVLMAGFVWLGKLPPELTMMIPLLALGAYVCAEIGKNIPILRNVGGAAIITTFLPSYLVYAHLLPGSVIKSVTDFTKQSNFLYLFICCITWDALVATLRPEILITIVSIVGTIMGTGFFVGRWVNLYPIESAIVNACHSGQGGTGDVAILTAANRMELMPFAQIATRIGGAITVTIAISALAWVI